MRQRGLALAVLLALAAPVAAQQPRPSPRPSAVPLTFGAEIEVINLNVTVTDARKNFVTDLQRKDFAVFEDGVRQELTLFTHEDLPISLVLMIDGSASMDDKLPAARAAALRFIHTLRPQDAAQVVQFSDRITNLQDFTSDQVKLEAAVNATRAAGPTSLYNALYVGLKDLERGKTGARELRRRAVIVLSDGEDTASLVNDDQVLDLARRTEIGVYAIRLVNDQPARDVAAFSQATHFMTVLSRDSGGQSFFPASLSELDAIYDRIAQELRTQYNLGYVSANRKRDGKWRRIVVRTPGRDDAQVRHKVGYFAPKTK